jgi:hypothetical protein
MFVKIIGKTEKGNQAVHVIECGSYSFRPDETVEEGKPRPMILEMWAKHRNDNPIEWRIDDTNSVYIENDDGKTIERIA